MKQQTILVAIETLLSFCMQAENDVKNVLFIAIDDLRPTLGCYGDPYAVTPNIDTFATKSFLFENTYCQQSVSGPSRASLLTGLRPDEIGVTDLNTHFREKCPYITTLPQLFKNNRYETIGIGKIYHGSTRTQDTVSWTRTPIYNCRPTSSSSATTKSSSTSPTAGIWKTRFAACSVWRARPSL